MAEPGFEHTALLLRRAQADDALAREELFRRYLPRLRQIVALRMGRRMCDLLEIDDVVQEAMFDACRTLERFEERGEGSFLHWLAELARNRLCDDDRRRTAIKRGGGSVRPFAAYESSVLSSSILPGADASPSELAQAAELERNIEAALLELPENYREAFSLHHLCGLSYEDMARQLGLKGESSARSLYSRALAELSGKLDL